jgi:hypothetical protein
MIPEQHKAGPAACGVQEKMMLRLIPVVLLAFGMSAAVISQTTAPRVPRNAAEFDELFQRVSN